MSGRVRWIPAWGFLISVLAIGVPYWSLPYREVDLPSALYGPGLGLLVAFSALALGCGAATFWKSVAVSASAAPVVVMLRVVFEAVADPTSHNLWPFEIVIASALGLGCALAGAVVGWMISKVRAMKVNEQ